MNAEVTTVEAAHPEVGGTRVLGLRGVGADGAIYDAVAADGSRAQLWRLHPHALTDATRRRLSALREASAPGLLPIVGGELEGSHPHLVIAAGGLRRNDVLAWGGAPDRLRRNLGRLAEGLAVAHRLDVVHGRLGLDCVAVDEEGDAYLDMTGLQLLPSAVRPHAPELRRGGRPSAATDVWALSKLAAFTPAADAVADTLAGARDPDPERRPRAAELAAALGATDAVAATHLERVDVQSDATRFGIPEHLGAYQLLDQLGAGGMGRVFRARDIAGGPDVALKVLLSNWARMPGLLARFRREARVLSQVESPFVTRYVTANEEAGFHYLVMELVDAPSLSALLKERPKLDVELAVRVVADVARALAEMHALGLVHRDIKPANVLVDQSGPEPKVKLCDFGIARPVEATGDEALTEEGGTPGTASYMAPEQIEGRPIDARSDVYALGATLYRLLAGRPPFVGVATTVMLAHISEAPPPLRDHDPSIPAPIADVVMKTLAKAPDDRYPDASAFHEALERAWRGAAVSNDALPQGLGIEGASKTYDFVWSLDSDPEPLWPHVSNTERLNRAAGLDDVEWSHAPDEEGYVKTEGSFRAAGMELRWRENPFEWVAPSRLGVVREYVAGPFEWLRSTVELEPRPGGGTDLRHRIEIRPRGLLGRAAASVEVGLKLRRGLERVYRRIDMACVAAHERPGGASAVDPFEPPKQADVRLQRMVDERLARVLRRGGDAAVVEALVELICTAPGPSLARIRPRAWAREQGLPEGAVLSTMLLAASEGALDVLWDLLCPMCRIPSGIEETLRSLESHGHCEACDLDFELDMARSVELVFRVSPALRSADLGVYCIGGPAHSPHVQAQVRLAKGERFTLAIDLSPGRYQVAGRGLPNRWSFTVDERAALDRWDLPLRAGASPDTPRSLRPGTVQIALTNDLSNEVVVRLERATLRDDAVTAADAAASSPFRALFPDQVLSPDRLIATSDVVLLFARLAGALDRYEEDEGAVLTELMQLSNRVQASAELEGGALVRIHGDGVVAVFSDRVAAARAALRVATSGGPAAGVALHAGSARMTSIGGRLDYFGKTVHVAEHLSRWAEQGELLVGESVISDPAIAPTLTERARVRGHLRLGGALASRLWPEVAADGPGVTTRAEAS